MVLLGLNVAGPFRSMSEVYCPEWSLPAPKSPKEAERRINAFWVCHSMDTLNALHGWATYIDNDDVTQAFPLCSDAFGRGVSGVHLELSMQCHSSFLQQLMLMLIRRSPYRSLAANSHMFKMLCWIILGKRSTRSCCLPSLSFSCRRSRHSTGGFEQSVP